MMEYLSDFPSTAIQKGGNRWKLYEIAVSNCTIMERKKFIFLVSYFLFSFELVVTYRNCQIVSMSASFKVRVSKIEYYINYTNNKINLLFKYSW